VAADLDAGTFRPSSPLFAAAIVTLLWRIRRFPRRAGRPLFAAGRAGDRHRHRPATSLTDRLATAPDDRAGQALWTAHRRRLLAALGNLRAGTPPRGWRARSRMALRFLSLVLIVVVLRRRARADRAPGEAFRGGEPRRRPSPGSTPG
jgi:hypothetical protein